jgi:hypothetical protein
VPVEDAIYSATGWCFFGLHWSERLHIGTKSCRACEDEHMAGLLARGTRRG